MRGLLMLAILVAAGACTERDGTYITIRTAQPFDHLEMFFGSAVGDRVPTSPAHAIDLDPVAVPQRLFARQFVDSDLAVPDAPTTEYTYYLPPTAVNLDLGEYLLVIADHEGAHVAAGELVHFEVATDVMLLYDAPLEPYPPGGIEIWGRSQASCVRWDRGRDDLPTVVAIGDDGDLDCDGFDDSDEDCDQLAYCDPDDPRQVGCVSDAPCVPDSVATCRLGSICHNATAVRRSCEADLCLPAAVCMTWGLPDSPAFREHLMLRAPGHTDDAIVPIRANNDPKVCLDAGNLVTVNVSIGRPCIDPRIEDFTTEQAPGEEFTPVSIAPLALTPTTCALVLRAPHSDYVMANFAHVLVSLGGSSLTGRPTFVLGLRPGTVGANEGGCARNQSYTAPIGTCQ